MGRVERDRSGLSQEAIQNLLGSKKFNQSSITHTENTKKSQRWSLITVFPRLPSLPIAGLLHKSGIKWHES